MAMAMAKAMAVAVATTAIAMAQAARAHFPSYATAARQSSKRAAHLLTVKNLCKVSPLVKVSCTLLMSLLTPTLTPLLTKNLMTAQHAWLQRAAAVKTTSHWPYVL